MKFYQDSGFKWTVASTFVLASIFALTSFSANAGAPISNPPGGNISPTFTNLTTATDVIVGKNLRIGDSIVPNSGKSFALAADKVNFTKDIEVAGNGIIGKVLQVMGSITGKVGAPLILSGDTEVKGGTLNINNGFAPGITINYNSIIQKDPNDFLHLGNNINTIDIPGSLNVAGYTKLGSTQGVSLNLNNFLKVAGLTTVVDLWSSGEIISNKINIGEVDKMGLAINYGGLSYDKAGKAVTLHTNGSTTHVSVEGIDFSSTLNPYSAKISYIAPGDASLKIDNPDVNFTGGIRVDGTMASKSIISTPKDIKAGGFIKAGGDITAGGNIFATGTINAVGGLATSDNLQIGGLITSSLGTATMKIQGTGVNISDELRVGGHLKAASIGKMDTSVGNSVTVVPKGSGHTTKYCESKSYQMLSCSPIYYGTQSGLPGIYFPMPKPDIYNGKAHIGNSFIDRYTDPDGIQFCDTTVYNQYASPIDFGIQTTCFDPNQ